MLAGSLRENPQALGCKVFERLRPPRCPTKAQLADATNRRSNTLEAIEVGGGAVASLVERLSALDAEITYLEYQTAMMQRERRAVTTEEVLDLLSDLDPATAFLRRFCVEYRRSHSSRSGDPESKLERSWSLGSSG